MRTDPTSRRRPSALRRAVLRLRRDERGVAGIEFCLFASVLVLLFVGAIELFDATRAATRAGETASTVADLTSRMTFVDPTRRDDLFDAAAALMADATTTDSLKVTITSIATRETPSGKEETKIVWSKTNKGAPLTDLKTLDLPTIPLGESVILAQIAFEHTYTFGLIHSDVMTFEDLAIRRPRFSGEVVSTGG